jgi:4-hydroxy-tetrahydrodipicolinate synthase
MIIKNPFFGLGIALITPFDNNGNVEYSTLSNLIEFALENDVDFLCVLGTTAETPTLTLAERDSIVRTVVKQVNGRIPIMVGCSSNSTSTVVEQLKSLNFDGVDAILSSVPYYNKPTQEGIYQHFKAIVEASPKPIVLYNIPGRTGVNMTSDTTLRLANSFEKIIAIKESSGDIEQVKDILSGKPEGFNVISGDDSMALDVIRFGGVGVISVVGNALPKTFGDMVHYALNNKYDEAESINEKLSVAYGVLFKEGNPCGIKDLMSSRGMINNVVRLPLVPVSSQTHEEIVFQFAGFKK